MQTFSLNRIFNHVPLPIGRFLKQTEYPFEHGEVINYTLDGVSVHSVTTNIQMSDTGILPNSVAGEEGNCSGISQ